MRHDLQAERLERLERLAVRADRPLGDARSSAGATGRRSRRRAGPPWRRACASATARFTATVLLPTPPLPAPTRMMFFTPGSIAGLAWRPAAHLRAPRRCSSAFTPGDGLERGLGVGLDLPLQRAGGRGELDGERRPCRRRRGRPSPSRPSPGSRAARGPSPCSSPRARPSRSASSLLASGAGPGRVKRHSSASDPGVPVFEHHPDCAAASVTPIASRCPPSRRALHRGERERKPQLGAGRGLEVTRRGAPGCSGLRSGAASQCRGRAKSPALAARTELLHRVGRLAGGGGTSSSSGRPSGAPRAPAPRARPGRPDRRGGPRRRLGRSLAGSGSRSWTRRCRGRSARAAAR